MASGVNGWKITNYPALATAPSASQAALNTPAVGQQTVRCRALQISCAGSAAAATGILQFVIRDGATGVGTIIWSETLQANSNSGHNLSASGLDIRASAANALTIECTSTVPAGCQAAVSMQGDYVPQGSNWYSTS